MLLGGLSKLDERDVFGGDFSAVGYLIIIAQAAEPGPRFMNVDIDEIIVICPQSSIFGLINDYP
jgi:hypothetical protein